MRMALLAALSGALAGLINGLFGTGGGLVLVPFFLRFLKLPPQDAMPTSVAVILPLCAVSVWRYRAGLPGFGGLWVFLLGGLVGGVVAGLRYGRIPAVWLRRIFGVFILYAGIRALFF